MNKVCPRCGNEFIGGRPDKIYCTELCRRHAERSRHKKTEGYRRKAAEAARRYNKRRKEGKVDTSKDCVCLRCGKNFEKESKRGAKPKYCGRDCREKHRVETQSGILTDVLCPICSKPLTQHQVRTGVTRCSKECYAATRRTLIGTVKKCVACGVDFEPSYKSQKCCGNECAKKQQAETKRFSRNTAITNQCVVCGQDFHPYVSMPNQLTCSKYCKRRRDSINKVKSGYRADVNRRRQVVISATTTEPIDKAEIFKRDGWVCQVCGKKVNPNLSYPHPMSASLDHILPFALGGSHTKANVQLAHLRCNIKKSDSGGGQLRLIGTV